MEYLFAKYTIADIINEVSNSVKKEINSLTNFSFTTKTIQEINEEIFKKHHLITPALEEDKLYQKEPQDTFIDISETSLYGRHSKVYGTKFEIILPFIGDKELLNARPTAFSMNVPHGVVYSNELRFIYQLPTSRDKDNVFNDFRKNLSNIKNWLLNTNNDVVSFNQDLKIEIERLVTARKKKLDDDKDAANLSGIPIK